LPDVTSDQHHTSFVQADADALYAALAHKDQHDPNDGADPLDTAAPNDIFPDDVNAEGVAHSLALSDHTHGIDCATPLEIAQVQAGAEGGDSNFARAQHVHAVNHGITDNHIVTVDDVGGGVLNEYAQWTVSGLRSRSAAEVLTDLSGTAGAGFDWNTQNLTNISALTAAGVVTGLTLEATGDTAAGDNSALGYTAAEGAILTGQGSTYDVTVKNDADATVIAIPTGTTATRIASDILMPERADHESTPGAGFGYLWCKNTAPTTLIFTDDTGADTTLGAGGGGGDITTDDAWVAAGDLVKGTGENTADILTVGAAHSILQTLDGAALSWETAPEIQYIKDTAGNTRITTKNGIPNVEIDNSLRCENLGIGTNPTGSNELVISPTGTISGTRYIMSVNPSLTIGANNIDLRAFSCAATATMTTTYTGLEIWGMHFTAKLLTNTDVTAVQIANLDMYCDIHQIGAGKTATVTDMYGVKWTCRPTEAAGTVVVTNAHGIYIYDPSVSGSPAITNFYGIHIEDITSGTNVYPIAIHGASDDQDHYINLEPNICLFHSLTAGDDFMGLATAAKAGTGVLGIKNAGSAPDGTSNPSGGGILYSTGGALHWLGSSGTDTTIAVA
jgi:hypothetical protein